MSKPLYDHICARLSELDMAMIESIPQGGNWRDIPLRIAKRSARLMQIRQSGGRTTYYGRLHSDFPSYTISTYFNRPGNGAFIHPTQNRLISLREAARLQSFPDDYRFLGSISSRFKQIGNAVPPLLARAIGSMIPRGAIVDLFAGAGGLSKGMELAGHKLVLAADINPNMCETLRYNHPDTTVLRSNVADPKQYADLLETANSLLENESVRVLVGGPPCQGFSTAGKWDPTDDRNHLYLSMLRAVNDLSPDYIVIENVPGIRWMNGGHAFHAILAELESMGYVTNWSVLKAEEYGVPQQRRRVFILASKHDVLEFPRPMFASISRRKYHYDPENGKVLSPVTVSEAISDLPPLTAGGGHEVSEYDESWMRTDYQKWVRGMIRFDNLLQGRSSFNTNEIFQ